MFVLVCTPNADGLCAVKQSGVPISGRMAHFKTNTGLAVSRNGSMVFVADTLDNMIRKVYCAAGINILLRNELTLK